MMGANIFATTIDINKYKWQKYYDKYEDINKYKMLALYI